MIRLGTLVIELGVAGTGINQAVRGIVKTQQSDVEAFVKRLADPREILVECVCAVVARKSGLPVPEPLIVLIPEQLGGPALAFGSSAVGHPNLNAWVDPAALAQVIDRLRAWKELIKAACFDEWIANCDRHKGNLLFDGGTDFWLIDHGLALHPQIPPDALAPANHLFALAVDGLPEGDLLIMRPKVFGIMQAYAEEAMSEIEAQLPDFWPQELREAALNWLEARQAHLLRLGSERIPARQSDMFDGRNPAR